jgi:hypothetical protein
MRFTVTWKPLAQGDLASLWTDADPGDRQAITEAASVIDTELAVDPDSLGESRPGGRRILFVPPLVVIFEVSEPDRMVSVLRRRPTISS